MHELALCGAIADIVDRRAGDRPVGAVHVRIGQLRQVIPDTLQFCWEMVVCGTTLDGARLEIEEVPAVLHCRTCAADTAMDREVMFACRRCGGVDVAVASGEEFLVTALELARN